MTGQALDRLNRLDTITDRLHRTRMAMHRRCMELLNHGEYYRYLDLSARDTVLHYREERLWAEIDRLTGRRIVSPQLKRCS